jgi:hypothetical protein
MKARVFISAQGDPDSMAGVRGLEFANVVLRHAGPNSLVSRNILVPESFGENCERADRRLGTGGWRSYGQRLIALDFRRKESVCPGS